MFEKLSTEGKKTGLKVNVEKTKIDEIRQKTQKEKTWGSMHLKKCTNLNTWEL